MKTKQLLKYQSLALVTGLAVFAALWATPEAAHGQVVGGDLFSTVNLEPFNNGGSALYQYTPQYLPPDGTNHSIIRTCAASETQAEFHA